MSKIIEIFFSKNMAILLLGVIIITMLSYSWYLNYYPTTFTNNFIILQNTKLKGKNICEVYDNNSHTMCYYMIPNSNYKIQLPQMVDDYINETLTIGIKISATRHVLYIKYNTTDIMNPIAYVELKKITKHSALYKTYCNKLQITYCKE